MNTIVANIVQHEQVIVVTIRVINKDSRRIILPLACYVHDKIHLFFFLPPICQKIYNCSWHNLTLLNRLNAVRVYARQAGLRQLLFL